MTFSPLATISKRIPDGGRSSPRQSIIRGVTLHHQAGADAHSEATNPAREVSANYWITNDGTIIPHISEDRRAWTTGARGYPAGAESDHRNITMEISNSPEGVRNGTWAISAAARASVVRLIADIFSRYNLGTVTRGTLRGIAVHRDFVPTACPGPYIMSQLSSIIRDAEALRNPPRPAPSVKSFFTEEELHMSMKDSKIVLTIISDNFDKNPFYLYNPFQSTKKKYSRAQWNALRKMETAGLYELKRVTVSTSELNAIPNG